MGTSSGLLRRMDRFKPPTDAPPETGRVIPSGPELPASDDRGNAPILRRPLPGSTSTESPELASTEAGEGRFVAPSPETVVVASGRRASEIGEEMRLRETLLRAEHDAEIAHLTDRLLHARKAHAAHIERLRA